MSHRDSRKIPLAGNAKALQQALQLLFTGAVFATISFRGDCQWTPQGLCAAAMLWACSGELTLTERWGQARRIAPVMVRGQKLVTVSYQAFLTLLKRWTDRLRDVLLGALRKRIPALFPGLYRLYGFVVFATDGSRIDLPRTRSHEAVYSPAKYRPGSLKRQHRKNKAARRAHRQRQRARRRSCRSQATRERQGRTPLMWVTTLWHVTTGLAWNWRLGPSDSSERAHLCEMLSSLPENSLIIGDAGFVGYDFLKSILDAGQNLLARVGANVRLLRKLGVVDESSQTVYLWPEGARRKQQPPLVLRLIVLHDGRQPVYLVTNVLSRRQLSESQVADLYRRRWGIELFYRHLKQTFGRAKLRSHNAENAEVEMHWSLLGLSVMVLNGVSELQQADIAPSRLSVSALLKAFRSTMTHYRLDPDRGESLRARLRAAVIDSYQRTHKASRSYPRKHTETPAGAPLITIATKSQHQLAAEL